MPGRKPLFSLFETAILEFGQEREVLRSVASSRYDKTIFPTIGQYDWFSGQALYCLVRHVKPDRIIEISTSSGYSTLFMALALKRNGKGRVDTFEIERKAATAAATNMRRWDVGPFVHIHVGDAKTNVDAAAGGDASILFLDSLHTEEFARWFIERFVLEAPPESLFHMHDIMPCDARVRRFGAPPFPPRKQPGFFKRLKNRIRGRVPIDDNVPDSLKHMFPPDTMTPLPTYDGNDTTEAQFGNILAGMIGPDDVVYCHHIADRFPMLTPREYDETAIGYEDMLGRPKEWNESLWTYCGPLAEAYRSVRGVPVGGISR